GDRSGATCMRISWESPDRESACGRARRHATFCTAGAKTIPSTTKSACDTSTRSGRGGRDDRPAIRSPTRWWPPNRSRRCGGRSSVMNAVARTEVKSVDQAIRDVIYRACLLLDHEKFGEWLALCAPEFSYRITTYSPEIRRQMTWFEQDVAGLKAMIDLLPK